MKAVSDCLMLAKSNSPSVEKLCQLLLLTASYSIYNPSKKNCEISGITAVYDQFNELSELFRNTKTYVTHHHNSLICCTPTLFFTVLLKLWPLQLIGPKSNCTFIIHLWSPLFSPPIYFDAIFNVYSVLELYLTSQTL